MWNSRPGFASSIPRSNSSPMPMSSRSASGARHHSSPARAGKYYNRSRYGKDRRAGRHHQRSPFVSKELPVHFTQGRYTITAVSYVTLRVAIHDEARDIPWSCVRGVSAGCAPIADIVHLALAFVRMGRQMRTLMVLGGYIKVRSTRNNRNVCCLQPAADFGSRFIAERTTPGFGFDEHSKCQ